MPLKSKRSPPKKKPVHKAKKPALKAVKISKPKMAAKSPPPQGSGILWKILAERERKAQSGPPKSGYQNHRGTQYPKQIGKHEQFARYAGPRRRAA